MQKTNFAHRMPESLGEIRCTGCGKLIGKAKMKDGTVEIKCSKCGTLTQIQATPKKPEEGRGYQDRMGLSNKGL